MTAVLEARGVTKRFPVTRGMFRRTEAGVAGGGRRVVRCAAGETLCIVGESGCGKSTLGRLVLRLIEPAEGMILIEGRDVTDKTPERCGRFGGACRWCSRTRTASLNPRLSAAEIVTEPMENFERLSAAERREQAGALLGRVGLRVDMLDRRPFEFSGGQRQRLGIARALSLRPALIVADEPVSALDVSVQAQVLNLMLDLQEEFGLAYLFISHDLGVVEHIGTRIAVMYLGRIVELADRDALFAHPTHPYTEALLQAAPVPDPHARRERPILEGEVPSPLNPPAGCTFHPRCPYAVARCREERPVLRAIEDGRMVACHLR